MTRADLRIATESTPKKSFAWAIDWPGWARSGKTPEQAIEILVAYRDRYAVAVEAAGLELDVPADAEVEIVDQADGGSGTEFGVPSAITDADHRPIDVAAAARLAKLVAGAWTVFDRVVASAPEELRKGPRGGGRDRTKMVGHVVGADWYYAREIGVRHTEPDPEDRAAIEALRADVLAVLRQPSAGTPLAGRRWTARYAARRIAWHAIDHAWEIEDRSTVE